MLKNYKIYNLFNNVFIIMLYLVLPLTILISIIFYCIKPQKEYLYITSSLLIIFFVYFLLIYYVDFKGWFNKKINNFISNIVIKDFIYPLDVSFILKENDYSIKSYWEKYSDNNIQYLNKNNRDFKIRKIIFWLVIFFQTLNLLFLFIDLNLPIFNNKYDYFIPIFSLIFGSYLGFYFTELFLYKEKITNNNILKDKFNNFYRFLKCINPEHINYKKDILNLFSFFPDYLLSYISSDDFDQDVLINELNLWKKYFEKLNFYDKLNEFMIINKLVEEDFFILSKNEKDEILKFKTDIKSNISLPLGDINKLLIKQEKIKNLITSKKEYKIFKIISKKYGHILNLDSDFSLESLSTNYFQQHYLEFLFSL